MSRSLALMPDEIEAAARRMFAVYRALSGVTLDWDELREDNRHPTRDSFGIGKEGFRLMAHAALQPVDPADG